MSPTACNADIFHNGEWIALLPGIPTKECEQWVQEVARRSGQRVDWFMAGGRNAVLAIGDLNKVRRVMKEEMADALYELIKAQYLLYQIEGYPSLQKVRSGYWLR